MLRELFGDPRSDDDEPWAEATRRPRERSETPPGDREPSAERQRENLTFALASCAVEALEDLALNVGGDPSAPRAHGPEGLGSAAGEREPRPEWSRRGRAVT